MLLTDSQARILFLSDTFEGAYHEKAIADLTPYPLPAGSELLQDLGYLGYYLPNVTMSIPHKRPRNGQLTTHQKQENRQLARRRIRIEHVIGAVKRCVILKEDLRLRADHIRDTVMEIGCGLHNLRVHFVSWIPAS